MSDPQWFTSSMARGERGSCFATVTAITLLARPRPSLRPMEAQEPKAPVVLLGHVSDDSIAATLYVVVAHGVRHRPARAASMNASVALRFLDGYAPVRIDFRGYEVEVGDDLEDSDWAHDLEVIGRMGDVTALITAPLTGGLPKPITRAGRAALARLADGRVEFDGPLVLGRKLLRVLALDDIAVKAPKERRADRPAPAG